MSDQSLLSVRNISTFYGRSQALFSLSMEVPQKGVVAVLGRNGAGKTTLLNTIAGELSAKEGEIFLSGNRIDHEPPHKRARAGIGYVPQEHVVFGRLTVQENLRVGGIRAGTKSFDKVLSVFPKLSTRLKQPAGTLSGGERKMLGIARALLGNPKVLLLDEPTEGVWVGVIEEIGDTLAELSKDMAVVIVEQNLELALRIASQVYVIDLGQVALSGTPDEMRSSEALTQILAP